MPNKKALRKYQKPLLKSSTIKTISLYSKRSLRNAADSEALMAAVAT